jgi:hypothetical protein
VITDVKDIKMKQIELRTGVKITHDKNGNIKQIKSPFDGDRTIKKRIFEEYYYLKTNGSTYHLKH